MPTLAELEAAYNGPIPRAALAFALSRRTPDEFSLMQARARAIGSRMFVAGQLRAIRRRRADGSFYPALLEDFRTYWRHYRAAMRQVGALRAGIRDTGAAAVRDNPVLAEAAE